MLVLRSLLISYCLLLMVHGYADDWDEVLASESEELMVLNHSFEGPLTNYESSIAKERSFSDDVANHQKGVDYLDTRFNFKGAFSSADGVEGTTGSWRFMAINAAVSSNLAHSLSTKVGLGIHHGAVINAFTHVYDDLQTSYRGDFGLSFDRGLYSLFAGAGYGQMCTHLFGHDVFKCLSLARYISGSGDVATALMGFSAGPLSIGLGGEQLEESGDMKGLIYVDLDFALLHARLSWLSDYHQLIQGYRSTAITNLNHTDAALLALSSRHILDVDLFGLYTLEPILTSSNDHLGIYGGSVGISLGGYAIGVSASSVVHGSLVSMTTDYELRGHVGYTITRGLTLSAEIVQAHDVNGGQKDYAMATLGIDF